MINVDQIRMNGKRLDEGAFHRALVVARALYEAGVWDGRSVIVIEEPYVTHNRVFGVGAAPVTALQDGVDYCIEGRQTTHDEKCTVIRKLEHAYKVADHIFAKLAEGQRAEVAGITVERRDIHLVVGEERYVPCEFGEFVVWPKRKVWNAAIHQANNKRQALGDE